MSNSNEEVTNRDFWIGLIVCTIVLLGTGWLLGNNASSEKRELKQVKQQLSQVNKELERATWQVLEDKRAYEKAVRIHGDRHQYVLELGTLLEAYDITLLQATHANDLNPKPRLFRCTQQGVCRLVKRVTVELDNSETYERNDSTAQLRTNKEA